MRSLFLTAVATTVILAAMPAAEAADRAVKAPASNFLWSGCYAGGTLGVAWAKAKFDWIPNPPGFAEASLIQSAAAATLDPGGVAAGAHIGCNYQQGDLVWGLEADWNFTDLDARRTPGITGISFNQLTQRFTSQWFSTFRGRVGWTKDRWLLFVTGGLAFADVHYSDFVNFPNSGTFNASSYDGKRAGWTLGAGAEVALNDNWSMKAEYLYVDLGSVSTLSRNSNPAFTSSFIGHRHHLQEHIGRIGVSYHFSTGQ